MNEDSDRATASDLLVTGGVPFPVVLGAVAIVKSGQVAHYSLQRTGELTSAARGRVRGAWERGRALRSGVRASKSFVQSGYRLSSKAVQTAYRQCLVVLRVGRQLGKIFVKFVIRSSKFLLRHLQHHITKTIPRALRSMARYALTTSKAVLRVSSLLVENAYLHSYSVSMAIWQYVLRMVATGSYLTVTSIGGVSVYVFQTSKAFANASLQLTRSTVVFIWLLAQLSQGVRGAPTAVVLNLENARQSVNPSIDSKDALPVFVFSANLLLQAQWEGMGSSYPRSRQEGCFTDGRTEWWTLYCPTPTGQGLVSLDSSTMGSEDATVAGTIVKVGTRSFTYTQKGIRSIPKVTSELSSRAFNLLRRHPGAYEQEKVRLQTCPNGPRQALEEDSCSHLHIRGIEEEVHQVLDVLVDTVSSKFVD
ncbi:hypothetical protein GUITHDRAFT_141330 [Guillardia theta CCMP2712]|uniref:Uncharacterized protein n=1 Tax=Guillardia theta (strain CCMP2712) TaxID=905079 RepID=L1J1I9_GUITC|nr:hypothetical protein GUITHDRAFT_141330 [Guillardia theta CCMP2712]EKX42388.1 hypothetical protein GUITHDRAFT_141330 [Guillardia theta CCMP2712]|eukprot:XP_005829368.1 hypothetical protein GUITHDRAFT_141330 [Guillardia theta CCMP2712]